MFTEKMINEYNNEQVVKLFGKQMEKISERKGQIVEGRLEEKMKIKQHLDHFRQQNSQIHKQLDETIEKFEDQFTDTANVVEYDSARLEKTYLKSLKVSKDELPCFSERSKMVACYGQNKNDPLACDAFMMALSECTDKAITTQ